MIRLYEKSKFALLALALVAGVTAVGAGEGEAGLQLGFVWPDEVIGGDALKLSDGEPLLGFRGGYRAGNRVGWFIDGFYSGLETSTSSINLLAGRTGVELFSKSGRWFFDLGGGLMSFDLDNAPSVERTFGSVSFGQRFQIDDGTFLRWELRGDTTIDDDGFGGEDLSNGLFVLGLTWGGGQRTDSDGDGVYDGRDKCPDTPRGATVDARGCPSDSDGDGVWDGIDRCPDTPSGWPVDATGCPTDGDGDGVPDGRDKCPDTPKGATVDDTGCPKDSDGDGVWDGIDKCPSTPKGAIVGKDGCPKDSDGDGVWDGIDKCPDTPKGAIVGKDGCPKDADGDGVWDGIDKCPETAKGVPVNPDGCPKAAQLFEEGKKKLILEGVIFEINSAKLTLNAQQILDGVAKSLADWPEVRVEIAGHTDSTGSDTHNQGLSERRANSVRDYLMSKGVSGQRMVAKGYGESKPIADNNTKDGRTKNRRVVLNKLD